ncbi:MAG: aldo/keto reductase [bacterium]
MEYRSITNIEKEVSVLGLGTWVFGGDSWWGKQDDGVSLAVMEKAREKGINFIDTAPFYGRGHSEEVVGRFIKGHARKEIILATKLGLDWTKKGFFNLKRDRMLREMEESLKRLRTDYIDLYQIHWPDPNTPVGESAETMRGFYEKGLIKAVGVSNYSLSQMKEFMKNCPLHCLQPPYNMFQREIEKEILPFCMEHGISVITYSPLYGGVLTGKFFLDGAEIPKDMRRKNIDGLKEPLFSADRKILAEIREIASKYGEPLSRFVLRWTLQRQGITSVLTGARTVEQITENAGAAGWAVSGEDIKRVDGILAKREKMISSLGRRKKI